MKTETANQANAEAKQTDSGILIEAIRAAEAIMPFVMSNPPTHRNEVRDCIAKMIQGLMQPSKPPVGHIRYTKEVQDKLNEYDKLKADNERMLEALKEAKSIIERMAVVLKAKPEHFDEYIKIIAAIGKLDSIKRNYEPIIICPHKNKTK